VITSPVISAALCGTLAAFAFFCHVVASSITLILEGDDVAKKAKAASVPHNAALITGDVITWARERLGQTQQQLASKLGKSSG